MTFELTLRRFQGRVEKALDACLPPSNLAPQRLHQAMRYASLDGGKRVRAALVYAAGHAVAVSEEHLDGAACAVELIHAYSLVHDDLPAMDDDDLRRGKPTCHRAYDEATALLVGDALQSLAFEVLVANRQLQVSPARRLQMIQTLTTASGSRGMAGGQAIDLASVGKKLTLTELETMHRLKTGALICASVALGALACDSVTDDMVARFHDYANCIGLAFQIIDDLLDEEVDTATLGKTSGADRANHKPTYPALMGLAAAGAEARRLQQQAHAALDALDCDTSLLAGLTDFIIERGY